MSSTYKITSAIACSLVCISNWANAQNVPQLDQTAPPNSVSAIALPQEVNVSQSLNYVEYLSPNVPVMDTLSLNLLNVEQLRRARGFRDGFDQTYQTVQFNATVTPDNQAKDIILVSDNRPQTDGYDFLPFSRNAYAGSGTGAMINAFNSQKSYYASKFPQDGYTSYSGGRYSSDANTRLSRDYAAGKSQIGQNRSKTTVRIVNHKNQVRIWNLNSSGLPVSPGYYLPNTLYGDSVINQQGNQVLTFYDKNNRLILKEIADSSYLEFHGDVGTLQYGYQMTYYVYDAIGRLRYTLTPKAIQLSGSSINATVLNNLCFQFKYDSRGRLSGTRRPGEDMFTEIVYDRLMRPVMKRDPMEQSAGQWEVTFYDEKGRVLATSLYTNSSNRDAWQNVFDNYNGATFPNTNIKYYIVSDAGAGKYPPETGISANTMMTYTWYDDYSHSDPSKSLYNDLQSRLNFTELLTVPGSETPVRGINTQGLVTGSKVRILAAPGVDARTTGEWRQSALYYDNKGRVIYTAVSDLFKGNPIHKDYSGIQYDFRNRLIMAKHLLINELSNDGSTTHTELTRSTYQNSTNHLVKTDHSVDGGPWNILAIYKYDDLGRIGQAVLGDYGEVRDYSYNIRGQLTGINGHYAETGDKGGESRTFGESLKYDYGFRDPRYDGKLSGIVWRGSGGAQEKALAYGYTYDLAGRLTTADFREGQYQGGIVTTPSTWDKDTMDYTVSNLTYDKNGNILTKDMRGPGYTSGVGSVPATIDQLHYTYGPNSNRLGSVEDHISQNFGDGDFQDGNTEGEDYTYNANGYLINDINKGLNGITYTFFNRPQVTETPNGSILDSYTASGVKVQELIQDKDKLNKTDYIGNFVYRNDSLKYASTGVGRTVWNNDTVKEEFFVKDHLGNLRSIIDVYHYPLMAYLASYEIASAQLEELFFDDVAGVRDDKPGSTDPEDVMAGRLNGAEPDHRVGTSILMKVMAGDKVQINADNYYDGTYDQRNDQPVSPDDILSGIVSTLTGGEGGLGESESHAPQMVPKFFSPANYAQINDLLEQNTDPHRPKAFLNYVLFDQNMRVVRTFTGAWQANGDGGWQTIGNDEPMTIPVNGFLAVYLSNATSFAQCEGCLNSQGDVYFDKLKIRLTKGNLKEENHYYPYGLPMASLGSSAIGMTPNRQKYQSNEYITGGGLNWMDFHNRQYDPQLGRFLSVDPLAGWGDQDRFSPFAAMDDEPASIADPLGLDGGNTTPPYFEGKEFLPSGSDVGTTVIVGYRIPDFSIRNFFGAVNAGGYWGNTSGGGSYGSGGGAAGGYGRGAYTSAVNSQGTLQSLSQSNEQGAGSTPAVAGNNVDGENGYNSNYEGRTGGDRVPNMDAFSRAARYGMMPFVPDAVTISIGGGFTYIAGANVSLNLTLTSDGIGGGITFAPTMGGLDASLGISMSMTEAVGNAPTSIANMVGGRGTTTEGGLGPVSVSVSQSFDTYGNPLYNSYGMGISFITFRDLPTPFMASYTTSPMTYEIPLFIWKIK